MQKILNLFNKLYYFGLWLPLMIMVPSSSIMYHNHVKKFTDKILFYIIILILGILYHTKIMLFMPETLPYASWIFWNFIFLLFIIDVGFSTVFLKIFVKSNN